MYKRQCEPCISICGIACALADMAKLCLNADIERMRNFYQFANLGNILLVGKGGSIDHDGGEPCRNCSDALFICCLLYTSRCV